MTLWSELAVWSGWLACGLSAILALPQALVLRRSPSVAGVSLLPWQALFAANVAWAPYALFSGQTPILVQTLVSMSITGVVITMICRATQRTIMIRIVIPILLGGVLLLTLPIPIVFGLVTSIPSLAGWSVQLARIRKTGRPVGLSFGGMLLYVLCVSVWIVYGITTADLALVASVLPPLLIVVATAIAYLYAPTDTSSAVFAIAETSGLGTRIGQIPLIEHGAAAQGAPADTSRSDAPVTNADDT